MDYDITLLTELTRSCERAGAVRLISNFDKLTVGCHYCFGRGCNPIEEGEDVRLRFETGQSSTWLRKESAREFARRQVKERGGKRHVQLGHEIARRPSSLLFFCVHSGGVGVVGGGLRRGFLSTRGVCSLG